MTYPDLQEVEGEKGLEGLRGQGGGELRSRNEYYH